MGVYFCYSTVIFCNFRHKSVTNFNCHPTFVTVLSQSLSTVCRNAQRVVFLRSIYDVMVKEGYYNMLRSLFFDVFF